MNGLFRTLSVIALVVYPVLQPGAALARINDFEPVAGPVQSTTPVATTAPRDLGRLSFPDIAAGSTGQLRIGQSFEEVRAALLEQDRMARISLASGARGRDGQIGVNGMMAIAVLMSPDRTATETVRLRFTSRMTGQRLYFIHRTVEFRRATPEKLQEFFQQMTQRYQASTWGMVMPGSFSFRQIFNNGRLLSWNEAATRPEYAACFLLSGGPRFEHVFEQNDPGGANALDTARCGGGTDADWRGDLGRFTVTMIDFPLYRDDREVTRRQGRKASPTKLGTSAGIDALDILNAP